MRIGIDFDNTLVNTDVIVNMFMKKNNIKKFKNEEQKTIFFKKYINEMMDYITLKDDAIEVLNRLSKKHELFLITARSNYYSNNLVDLTKKYMKDNKIPIQNMYFDNQLKSSISLELKIDLFIDDDISVIKDLNNHGIKTLIFNNDYKGVKIVNSWLEVENEVKLWMKELSQIEN